MTELSILPDAAGMTGGPSLHAVPEATITRDENFILDAPPTKREREAQWMESALDAFDLTVVPLADLRIMANRMFRLLDSSSPPLRAGERYAEAAAEIEERSRSVAARGGVASPRQVVTDSAMSSRFELFIDGCLAAYVRYSLLDGRLTLRALVERPGFEGQGLGRVLMRQAMLSAHKRRLDVVPGCTAAHAFLERNPQYRVLVRSPR